MGQDFELITVDMAKGAQKSPEFLRLNHLGQVPVLDDDGIIIADSNAILVYVARKLGRTDWLPDIPADEAAVQRWLSVAAGQIAYGPAAARLATLFGAKLNLQEAIDRAHAILKIIDQELAERVWIALDRPTIADVALYSYIARAPEGNVDLSRYPAVNRWLGQIEALPGFIPFEKSPIGLGAGV
jgi:glutathione S-transferase